MRQTPYSAALVDIRLPDLDGYEAFKRLREVQPNVPIILMTGFGWDPTHSIVKARQEGLQTVLVQAISGRSPDGSRRTGSSHRGAASGQPRAAARRSSRQGPSGNDNHFGRLVRASGGIPHASRHRANAGGRRRPRSRRSSIDQGRSR